MAWLDYSQSAMMAALDHGPAYLPDGLFAGATERVLAGMSVHANTISHARLVALEETFPRTRDLIGHDRFNEHSRLYLQQPGVTARSLAQIGGGFTAFLIGIGEDHGVADLLRFEWLWLQSYHALDAEPLELGALVGLSPDNLRNVVLARHPAAKAEYYAPLVHDLLGAEVAEITHAEAILLTRATADVLIAPATARMVDLLAAADVPRTIGDILSLPDERQGVEAQQVDGNMQALVTLIAAGALMIAR